MSVSRDFIDSYSPEAPRPSHKPPAAPVTAGDEPECEAITLVFGFQRRRKGKEPDFSVAAHSKPMTLLGFLAMGPGRLLTISPPAADTPRLNRWNPPCPGPGRPPRRGAIRWPRRPRGWSPAGRRRAGSAPPCRRRSP